MSHISNKTVHIWLPLLSVLFMLTLACKKEPDVETNNPNIVEKRLNITLPSNPIINPDGSIEDNEEFDVNDDGINDFNLYYFRQGAYSYNYIQRLNSNQLRYTYIFGGKFIYNTPKGDPIMDPYGMSIWTDQVYGSLSADTFLGFAGAGDVLTGFRIAQKGAYHYGWFRINISAKMDTIHLIETAYHIRSETQITAGSK